MTTEAWLEGDPFDLRDLAELLPSGNIRVLREDNAYYLTAPEFDNPPEGTQFYKAAARLIECLPLEPCLGHQRVHLHLTCGT